MTRPMLPPTPDPALPAVDERLVAPETPYEIIDGKVVRVSPSDEPHATVHSSLGSLLRAHRDPAFEVALDMLTRTSAVEDFAPDASVYPGARDPVTEGRQLEQLAFEIASTQSLGDAARKAAKLIERGVRRVFAIDIERARALEWSAALQQWSILDRRSVITDPALAVPLPVDALIDTARADDAVVRAFRRKRHPEFLAERAEGHAEGLAEGLADGLAEGLAEGLARGEVRGRIESLLTLLSARGLIATQEERLRITSERDAERLMRWMRAALACASIAELLQVD